MGATTSGRGAGRHRRRQDGVLAGPEKRLLVWMAERLPDSIGPDHLSVLALAAMVIAGLGYWAASRSSGFLLVVVVALAVNWFGDSMDGTVARVRGRQRPRYGYYVDHVLDLAGTTCLVAGMALSEFMSPLVALSFLVAWLTASAERYLATHARGVFRMSLLRIGPTELRILLAAGTLLLLRSPWIVWGSHRWLLLDVGGVVGAVVLGAGFVVAALRNALELAREDRPPEADPTFAPGSNEGPRAAPVPQAGSR